MSDAVSASIKQAKAAVWEQLVEARRTLAALERVEADVAGGGKAKRRPKAKARRALSAAGKAAISRAAKARWKAFRAARDAKAKAGTKRTARKAR